MSKLGVLILSLSFVALMGLYIQFMYTALYAMEADALRIMNTWCGPETARRFEER